MGFSKPEDCTGWQQPDYHKVVVPLVDGDLRIYNGSEAVISS